jgi:predicted TIM-barrel fold metal-dependent hydrolase
MTVIDCHALAGKGVTWTEPEREVDYDPHELLERAAEAGIDRVCILSPRTTDYRAANRYIAHICEQRPEKLIGFAVHSPERESGRIAQILAEEVNSIGLRGVRSDGHPTRELLDAAAELKIPVIYYPKRKSGQGPGRWFHMIAPAYPQVQFILPHLGEYRSETWWGHMEAVDLVKRYPNLYVDTSGIGSLKYLEMAAKELPPERVLFGSFAPELDSRVGVEAVRLLHLSTERHEAVMGMNMLRLLRKS